MFPIGNNCQYPSGNKMIDESSERGSQRDTGERLRLIRGDRSQKDFAELLGIGRTTLIRYEAGTRPIDVELLVKLNLLFGTQPLWLLTGAGTSGEGVQLTSREAMLLKNYRNSPEDAKVALERTSAAFAQPTDAGKAGASGRPT
ncbi:helix-turn-helix transcriptional regulator [Stenotrophomonas maltophilia]|nr:helix-turn-helix transcriptional regulator [Stenotrophomonas maltophilia]